MAVWTETAQLIGILIESRHDVDGSRRFAGGKSSQKIVPLPATGIFIMIMTIAYQGLPPTSPVPYPSTCRTFQAESAHHPRRMRFSTEETNSVADASVGFVLFSAIPFQLPSDQD